jgi:hypothetical protein
MQRLLERLQTGWQPTAAEIPPDVPQHHLDGWRFVWSVRKRRVLPLGDSPEPPAEGGFQELTEDVLWIDAGLRWALCADGVFGGWESIMSELVIYATPLISLAIAQNVGIDAFGERRFGARLADAGRSRNPPPATIRRLRKGS